MIIVLGVLMVALDVLCALLISCSVTRPLRDAIAVAQTEDTGNLRTSLLPPR
jgi:HAMP domain-containing protein